MNEYTIKEIDNNNTDSIISLRDESHLDGTKLVDKMIDEWKSGENTFSKPGEKAWGLFVGDQCIAFAGINIDPYLEGNDGSVGRVRHVYVAQAYRGKGLSKVLMNLILPHAREHFKVVRLATMNPIAAHVYESFGFAKTGEINIKGAPTYSLDM